jgi:hypothetical protein
MEHIIVLFVKKNQNPQSKTVDFGSHLPKGILYALSEPVKDEGENVKKDIRRASVELWSAKVSLTAPLGAS